MYAPTEPSEATRPARFAACAIPFSRSHTAAFSRSPLLSASAFLQSITPAPVLSRSSLTRFAFTSIPVSKPTFYADADYGASSFFYFSLRPRYEVQSRLSFGNYSLANRCLEFGLVQAGADGGSGAD